MQDRGKNRHRRKTDPLSIAVNERDKSIINTVRVALENGQVMLAFQPVVQAARPGRAAFYEGLIRVTDGTGRIIPAREFINDVEDTEMGRMIDCYALELGFRALQTEPSLRLSINMSAKSISYPRWTRTLNRGLLSDPTIGERLILEVTERTAIAEPANVRTLMDEAQARGVSFALDDFGAGNTTFRYLKDFYFDILKIDGQFIRGISQSPDDQVLTSALISVAQQFDMFTVAEMIENEQDAEFVVRAGIDCMQGNYFGAPTVRPYWMQDHWSARKTA